MGDDDFEEFRRHCGRGNDLDIDEAGIAPSYGCWRWKEVEFEKLKVSEKARDFADASPFGSTT